MKIKFFLPALCLGMLVSSARCFAVDADTASKPSDQHFVSRSGNSDAGLIVPPGFSASLVATGLGGARHIAVSPGGDIYVKLSRLKNGNGIFRLRDIDGDGVADQQSGFGNYTGTGMFLKNGYLYASSNQNVYRYKLNQKYEIISPEDPELIVKGLVARGRDESKSIVVDSRNNLYVTVGSYSNACVGEGSLHGSNPCSLLDSIGGIWQFRADKLNQQYGDGVHYAKGLKNVVGLDWNKATGSLFAMQHGREGLHKADAVHFSEKQERELPAETMFELHKGADAGWPYVYYDHIHKKKMLAPEYGGDGKKTGGEKALNPVAAFPAHLAPDGLLFYTGNQFPARYKNGAFIAFHGFSSELQKGFFVAFIPFRNGKPVGNYEIFADNFGAGDGQPAKMGMHRPCGLAQGPDGSLYVTDDIRGNIYRIQYGK